MYFLHEQLKSIALDHKVHPSIFATVQAAEDSEDGSQNMSEDEDMARDDAATLDEDDGEDDDEDHDEDHDEDDAIVEESDDQSSEDDESFDYELKNSQGARAEPDNQLERANHPSAPVALPGLGAKAPTPTPCPASVSIRPTLSPWEQAIVDANIPASGSGLTRESPIIVGGRGHDVTGVPMLTFPLTASCDATSASHRQEALELAMQQMTWHGPNGNRHAWLRLHPFAVRLWVKHLTSRIFSIHGIRRVNKILNDARKGMANGNPQKDIAIARGHEENTLLTSLEKAVFRNVARVAQHQVPKNDVYDEFMAVCDQYTLHLTLETLSKACQDFDPQRPRDNQVRMSVWSALDKDGSLRGTGELGVTERALVKRYIIHSMNWEDGDYERVVGNIAAFVPLIKMYGAAFCLFIDKDFLSM